MNRYSSLNRKKSQKNLAVIAAVILALILINIIFALLPDNFTKLDITDKKIFSLSKTTQRLVKSIEDEINIYLVFDNTGADDRIYDFINRYALLNDKIKIHKVDAQKNSSFLSKYTDKEIPINSVIVESEKRFRVITNDRIYSTTYTNEEIQYYYLYGIEPVGTTTFNGEAAITSALDYVTTDKLPKVYVLSGHGEAALNDELSSYIEEINIDVVELNLLTLSEVPSDANTVIIIDPQRDLSESDYTKLEHYISGGGNLIFVSSYGISKLTNFHNLMLSYGMKADDGVVFETGNNHMSGAPSYIIPSINPHTIKNMRGIENGRILMPNSHAIEKADIVPENCVVQTLFSTSEKAYIRYNLENTDPKKTEGDKEGLYNLAMISEIENVNGTNSNVIWFASIGIIDELADELVAGANYDYFIAGLKFTVNKSNTTPVSIEAKSLYADFLIIGEKTGNFLAVTCIVILPLTFLVAGYIICRKRIKI